nr:hydroxymethylglutaryl-CoA reductase, degradative [Candidatus Sigynarchaeota archaeon]
MVKSSALEKFYTENIKERAFILKELCNLDDTEVQLLTNACDGSLVSILNSMVENVVGTFPLPLAIATNFTINGKDRLVAMAIEEASVVAAASNAARMARTHGGFTVEPVQSMMIGQVQLINVPDAEHALAAIRRAEKSIIDHANAQDPVLVKAGGGARRIDAFKIATDKGCMLDVHIVVDCLDAMGANAVNTMAEAIAPTLEEITGGETLLKIISNLAIHRIVRARATFDKNLLGGDDVVVNILDAVEFARHDIFRATTHNKGIMNGVSAVVLATGNDTRAVEAGAHA